MRYNMETESLLRRSAGKARNLGHSYVGSAHLLLAMAAGLVAAFLALGKVFAVNVYDGRTAGVMLLMMGCAAVLFWGLTCLVEAIGNRRRK